MKELVAYLAKVLVDNPAAVEVRQVDDPEGLRYEITVAPDDIGKVIGKEGKTVKALRTLLAAVAQKSGQHADLEIMDGRDRSERRERRPPR